MRVLQILLIKLGNLFDCIKETKVMHYETKLGFLCKNKREKIEVLRKFSKKPIEKLAR